MDGASNDDGGGFFNKALGWLGSSSVAGSTPNWLGVAGMAGSLYDGYQTHKNAKKMQKLQNDTYNFNKMLSERQLSKDNQAQNNLERAWANSRFNVNNDDEERLY
ncbi:hypothetical protein BFG04_04390 [Campylobacter pinnipediorum subsp. pinnipediorum]|uniref:Uncharacterized protein n=2 Tax=Campylobacter TaxID=194 RepID=A0AAX0LAE2_9BACT|nr:hypothetical protein BFG04_04390 [Campylobacter pinnipediorum subsp. pinnipediorum]